MKKRNKTIEIDLNDTLSKAVDLTENKFNYANNIRFNIGQNEVTLDFYFLGVNPAAPEKAPMAQRLNRVVMPISVAKELAQIVLNGVTQWEDTFGINLPLLPQEMSVITDQDATELSDKADNE